jgi:hypothetical protein
MLIRIAPDMFVDERFECATVKEVCEEIFRTTRFKTKCPWRIHYKNKILPSGLLRGRDDDYDLNLKTIEQLLEAGKTSAKTGKAFGLSRVDTRIAAYATTYDLEISSTDNSLIDFLQQEFDKVNRSPLAILNFWIEKGLVQWNEDLLKIIEDWEESGEPVQPAKDKMAFLELTGAKYAGP